MSGEVADYLLLSSLPQGTLHVKAGRPLSQIGEDLIIGRPGLPCGIYVELWQLLPPESI
jgi:hypothetical protein